MEADDVNVDLLQKVAHFCMANPVTDASSPTSTDFGYPGSPSPFSTGLIAVPNLHSDVWETDRNFDRLFMCLIQFLDPLKVWASHIAVPNALNAFVRPKKKLSMA